MTPSVRAQYLQQMGIVAYVPRLYDAEASSESAPISSVHILFLFQSSTLNWDTPEQQLLKKIMQSTGLPEEAMAVCHAGSLPITPPTLNPTTKIVAFGRGLTVSLPKGTIETVTLTELQHNDTAKRHLWQQLKAIKASYGI
jgi:DNA polymerase III psi subunit